MRTPHLHLPHLHLSLERLTRITGWGLAGLAVILTVVLVWFSYSGWYEPLRVAEIPEDKLSQKREQVRVKDFENARSALESKQKPAGAFDETPF